MWGTLLTVGAFALLLFAERRRPLRATATRPAREPRLRRDARNLAIAGVAAASLQIVAAPLILPITRQVDRRHWGLLPRLHLPRALATAAALLLLDYTFYLWHRMAHRVPFIWRFHVVHHADLDLTASTALRFHFGELMLGVPFQAAQVALIGVGPATYSTWQALFLLTILFHHSDWKLPLAVERALSRFLVTPRMHGIHHSDCKEEADSNWSSGLNLWDRLHGSLRLNVPQEEIVIGVPAYRDPVDVEFTRLLRLPFERQAPSWLDPSGAQLERVRSRIVAPGADPSRLLA